MVTLNLISLLQVDLIVDTLTGPSFVSVDALQPTAPWEQARGLQDELHKGLYINYTWAICAARDASCLVRCKASHSVNIRRSSAVGWLRAAASAACNPDKVHSHALGTMFPS